MMANFMCQIDWATGCPGIWSNTILSVFEDAFGLESWTVNKAEHRRINAFELVVEKTLESPFDCKEIQPVHSEGDQPWDFFGRTDAKAETPVLWPPHAKC